MPTTYGKRRKLEAAFRPNLTAQMNEKSFFTGAPSGPAVTVGHTAGDLFC